MLRKLRRFRGNGLGYMSLGLRVPNFPNSAGPSGLLFWEIWTFGNMYLCAYSHFPIFANSAEPYGLRTFSKFGKSVPLYL